MTIVITDREYHTLQAALQCWKAWLRGSLSNCDAAIVHLDAVASNDHLVTPLSPVETSNLWIRLETQADPAAQVERQCDLNALQDDLAFLLVLVERIDKQHPQHGWLSQEEHERLDAIHHDAEAEADALDGPEPEKGAPHA